MDRDFAEGLIGGLNSLRAARAQGGKAAVEAACKELEERLRSVGALFGFLEQRRKKCKPTWAMEQIIWYIECESRRPGPNSLRAILGMLSGDQESAELSRFLERAGEAGLQGDGRRIDLRQWRKGGCRNLMQDLIEDALREGVVINPRRHGENQPKELRRSLRERHDLPDVAGAIQRVEGKKRTYKLTIPYDMIECESPKT